MICLRKLWVVIFVFFLFSLLNSELLAKQLTKYAIAVLPTPVLNTPDFSGVFGGENGSTLRVDEEGKILELELICLPKSIFKIEETIEQDVRTIYEVTTNDYPYPTQKGYFIDSRFVEIVGVKPFGRVKKLSSNQTIIQNLLSTQGSNYLWGGNYKDGISQMLSFYEPTDFLPINIQEKWMLKGLDCSGLLYYATNGYTPRNTSSLVNYGNPVPIVGLKVGEIIQKVESLDIIVWIGHVIVILDRENVIESRLDYEKYKEGFEGGVRIRQLKEVLMEVIENRVPVDDYKKKLKEGKKKFVIRRWYEKGDS